MAKCDACGREVGMPYQCRHCGGTFCADHRLPENHGCPGLDDWGDPSGVFSGAGPDTSRPGTARADSGGLASRLGIDTGRGGPLGYFRENVTFVFLAIIWVTFLAEIIVLYVMGDTALFQMLFVLSSDNILRVWTWVTSVFSHSPGGFAHIFLNSLVLYFFGPVVERRIGSKKFTALFILSGAIAGLAQVTTAILVGESSAVLGASGAILALMGVLTVLNPNLRIYLYFIIPMPLWIATLLFAAYSVFVSTVGGIGAGNVAQIAHLAGLVVGLLYGVKLKREGERAPKRLQFGGGGRGGPGGRF